MESGLSIESMKWQSIETAPKDGTLVLITDGVNTEVAKNFGDDWISSDGLDFGYGNWDSRLTHWMPLPKLPIPPPR